MTERVRLWCCLWPLTQQLVLDMMLSDPWDQSSQQIHISTPRGRTMHGLWSFVVFQLWCQSIRHLSWWRYHLIDGHWSHWWSDIISLLSRIVKKGSRLWCYMWVHERIRLASEPHTYGCWEMDYRPVNQWVCHRLPDRVLSLYGVCVCRRRRLIPPR